MSKSVLLPTRSVTMVILLLFLALPFISSADQVEDIPEIEQQVQPVGDSAAKNINDPSPSVWKRLLGFMGLDDGRPATPTVQEPMANYPVIMPSEKQVPVATAEKGEVEKPAAGKSEQDRINAEKSAAETMKAEKAEPVRPAAEHSPVSTQKTAGTQSSSMWQSILAFVGLHDDRHAIPPMEVQNTPLLGQDYIVGPGDLLGISVWRDDSLTRSVVVLPDGKIQFPLIGEILAGGKTVAQLKQVFVEKLSSYVVDADISVEVKQSNSLFIYIIGRVNSPGRQMLIADTTVLQALAMAGGLNPYAEKDDIKVFRQDRDRTLVYSFRYSQVISGNYLDDNLLLRRGDVIVVP